MNPNHDDRGRFADKPGAGPIHTVQARSHPRRRRATPAAPPPRPTAPPALDLGTADADLQHRLGVAPPPPKRPGDDGPRPLSPPLMRNGYPPSLGQLHDGLFNGLQVQIERQADRDGERADSRRRTGQPLRDTVTERRFDAFDTLRQPATARPARAPSRTPRQGTPMATPKRKPR